MAVRVAAVAAVVLARAAAERRARLDGGGGSDQGATSTVMLAGGVGLGFGGRAIGLAAGLVGRCGPRGFEVESLMVLVLFSPWSSV